MEEKIIQRINPWVSIWKEPRKTIRNIVNYYGNKYVLTLALLTALVYNLNGLNDSTPEVDTTLIDMFYPVFFKSLTLGLMAFYFYGFLLYLSGKVFKGKATKGEVYIAMAWSSIPTILGLFLWIPKLMLFGKEWFYENSDLWDNDIYLYSSLFIIFIDVVLLVYGTVIFIIALSEVQGFSKRKAFFSSLVVFIIIAMLMLLIVEYLHGL